MNKRKFSQSEPYFTALTDDIAENAKNIVDATTAMLAASEYMKTVRESLPLEDSAMMFFEENHAPWDEKGHDIDALNGGCMTMKSLLGFGGCVDFVGGWMEISDGYKGIDYLRSLLRCMPRTEETDTLLDALVDTYIDYDGADDEDEDEQCRLYYKFEKRVLAVGEEIKKSPVSIHIKSIFAELKKGQASE